MLHYIIVICLLFTEWQKSLTKLHHVLVCLVNICDELLEEGVGKSFLDSRSVQLLRLHTSGNNIHTLKGMIWHYGKYSNISYYPDSHERIDLNFVDVHPAQI